jgi:hypothetical protein
MFTYTKQLIYMDAKLSIIYLTPDSLIRGDGKDY